MNDGDLVRLLTREEQREVLRKEIKRIEQDMVEIQREYELEMRAMRSCLNRVREQLRRLSND